MLVLEKSCETALCGAALYLCCSMLQTAVSAASSSYVAAALQTIQDSVLGANNSARSAGGLAHPANNNNIDRFTKIVFFPDIGLLSGNGVNMKESTALRHMVHYLDTARSTIDVCVLLLTCTALSTPLINAKVRALILFSVL